ncbi:cytochrome b/b6 domain-containing protein [Devosia sp. FJ2-5-3]|uniref:cytochrome b/b6 domain-containing protein n=1 Tax=Devosia sp. FJ2-5-3 TaxID=2976680 RepID=UPI0023D81F24|nr:cytochrome b/b6 domain-containing protein [Devosia sp. FJ2-5-3]WEJ56728.1 cytochrome b/b6 domain-containing protein [Devosia sp. FJ2-5-3]
MAKVTLPAAADTSAATVKVWDPVVRLFHWTIVTGVVLNLWVFEHGKYAHRLTGYVVVAALATRLVWGIVGTRHARFSDFFPTPRRVITHVYALWRGEDARQLGHSALGALMMLALMAVLTGLGLTGWMMGLDAFWGVKWVEDLHGLLANSVMALAILHVAAAVIESVRHGENLPWAMITGRKRALGAHDADIAD